MTGTGFDVINWASMKKPRVPSKLDILVRIGKARLTGFAERQVPALVLDNSSCISEYLGV